MAESGLRNYMEEVKEICDFREQIVIQDIIKMIEEEAVDSFSKDRVLKNLNKMKEEL